MKKIFVYMASAALMFAVSCNKEEVNVDTTAPVETELITVDLNPMTKTALGADGATTWDAGDEVSVTVGGEVVGTLSLVEGSTFSGEITAGLSGEAVLNYPAGVTTVPATQTAVAGSFADEAALLEGSTTVEELRAGTGVELKNKTALLKFTVAQAGDVTFEVGTAKYTVTGCKTGSTYYACVTPVEDVAFVARIGGYLSKQASNNVTFTASKIADLKELPTPTKSGWSVQGLDGWTKSAEMFNEGNWSVAYNVKSSTKYFKFNKGSEWIGGKMAESEVITDYAYPTGGNNIQVKNSNTAYDFYFCKEGGMFMVLPAGTSVDEIYVATDMFLRGNYTKTGFGWNKGYTPTMHDGKFYGWKNVKFDSAPQFKFSTSDTGWDWQYSAQKALTIGTWTTLNAGSSVDPNTTYSKSGTYDIYTTSDGLDRNQVVIVEAGSPIPTL